MLCFKTNASSYSLNGVFVELPFPKEWLAKKARKLESSPLVFFEKGPSPRIASTLYATVFNLNSQDYSAFRKDFIKSKLNWLAKEKAEIRGEIVLKLPKLNDNTVRYQMTFKNINGEFQEWGLFFNCKGQGMTVKSIVPAEKVDSKIAKEIHQFYKQFDPCTK